MLNNQRGSGLLLVIIIFAVLFSLVGMSLDRSGGLFVQIQKDQAETAALNLAEAGVEYTLDKMLTADKTYAGETKITLETGTFATSVVRLNSSGKIEIVSTGAAKGVGHVKEVIKIIKVTVQRSPENTEPPLLIRSREEVF